MPGFRSNYRGTKNLCKRRRRRKMSKRSRFALLLFFTRLISVLSMFAFHASRSPFRSFLAALSSNGCRDRLQENAPREVSVLGRGNRRALSRRKRSFRSNLLPTLLSSSTFPLSNRKFGLLVFFPQIFIACFIDINRDYSRLLYRRRNKISYGEKDTYFLKNCKDY